MAKFVTSPWGVERVHKITTRSSQKDIQHVFTRGHCHSLALALNKLTGWPLYGMFNGNECQHVIVKSPKGYVDIEGLHVDRRWPNYRIKPITRAYIHQRVVEYNRVGCGYMPSNTRGAMPFAKQVRALVR